MFLTYLKILLLQSMADFLDKRMYGEKSFLKF